MIGRFAITVVALGLAGTTWAMRSATPTPEREMVEPVSRQSNDLDESQDMTRRVMAATEIKAAGNGHFFARAEIGKATLNVMVDTGATAIAMSYEDADDAGLSPGSLDYDIPVMTANGIAKAARVMIDKVEVDGVSVRDVEGYVMPEGAMKGTLLGMSYLSKLSSFKVENGVLYLED
jgi:clan AA aspartic protease (TIGR02281 family)